MAQTRVHNASRGVRACLMLAVGVGALTYWHIGDLTVGGRPSTGLATTFGPYSVPLALLRSAGLISGLVGITGLFLLTIDVVRRRLSARWFGVAGASSAAAAVTAWAWRCVTAGWLGDDLPARATGVAAIAVWVAVAIWAAGFLRRGMTEPPALRGCTYCAEDRHVFGGDVQQVSAIEDDGLMLLKCPRCDWLYVVALPVLADVVPVSEADARERFPSTW